jgi:hypothetical protein
MTGNGTLPIPEANSAFMRAAGLRLVAVGPTEVTGWIEVGQVRLQNVTPRT